MPLKQKNNIANQALLTIKRYAMFKKKDLVVVAVSGGPDSLALLFLLNSFKKNLGIKLHIAHLDHGLRNDSSDDLLFVEDLCRRLKLPVTAERIPAKSFPEKGSTEENARLLRYNFLFKVADKIGATRIAVGHTKDDQAETVLMRLLRGSGLSGLSGILPVRNIAGYTVVRPLIDTTRKDIENYLKTKRIKAKEDSSNSDTVFFRNKVRHELIPLLEKKYNPNIKDILAKAARNLGSDYEYLSVLGRKNSCKTSNSRKNQYVRKKESQVSLERVFEIALVFARHGFPFGNRRA